MQAKVMRDEGPERVYQLVFDEGDEAVETLKEFAAAHAISGAWFTALGAFERATIRYFDWEEKEYKDNPVEEQVEVASLVGNLATTDDGETKVHAHVVLGRRDGSALAGHLKEGYVRPTLELVLADEPAGLRRVHDDRTGLTLIAVDQPVAEESRE